MQRKVTLSAGTAGTITLVVVLLLAVSLAVKTPWVRARQSGRVVTDDRSMAVAIPLPFRGAAILFPPTIDDYTIVTRKPQTVLAAHTLNRGPVEHGLLGRMFPALASSMTDLPSNAASTPNIETLLGLQPSAVFVPVQSAAALDRVGLPTLGIINTMNDRFAIARARMYAEANGDTTRGPELVTQYQARMKTIERDLAYLSLAQKPSILIMYGFQGVFYGMGIRTLPSDLVNVAGGRNVLRATGGLRLDLERILLADPDTILLMNTWPSGLRPKAFLADPAWQPLRAVRQRRVYRIISGIELFPDGLVAYPLFVRWLAELLHPELPATLRADTRDIYRQEVGYEMTDADLDEALAVAENAGTTNARRFEAP